MSVPVFEASDPSLAMHADEPALVAATLRGHTAAFGQLVELYQVPIFNLCYRMLSNREEAEDAAQETFVRAYTRLQSYDPRRRFSSWLFSIAAHHCIDRLRRQRVPMVPVDEPGEGYEPTDGAASPEAAAIEGEARREVRRLLAELPPDYRAALVLRYWYDLSYEEMADILNISVSAVKSRLHRARQSVVRQAAESGALAIAQWEHRTDGA